MGPPANGDTAHRAGGHQGAAHVPVEVSKGEIDKKYVGVVNENGKDNSETSKVEKMPRVEGECVPKPAGPGLQVGAKEKVIRKIASARPPKVAHGVTAMICCTGK